MIIMEHDEKPLIAVTGSTSGVGEATVLELARRGAKLVLVARQRDRGEAVAAEARSRGAPQADVVVADLSRQSDVHRLAADLSARGVAAVAHVAGVMKFDRSVTDDGVETTLATNHLAPYLLTRLMVDGSGGRLSTVVLVTSGWHTAIKAVDWNDLQLERGYDPARAYQTSKVFNLLFALALERHCPRLRVCTVDPGYVRTSLGREARGLFKLMLQLTGPIQSTPEAAARTIADCLTDASMSGFVAVGGKPGRASALASSVADAERLWTASAALTGLA
jgi:NAD(P)-dependent dehydrogenase (short-subunit alcohol dehydrogenase family)